MGIFTSSKRRAAHAAQSTLTRAKGNASRLRMFLPTIAAGLDSEGYRYAHRATGVLVAIASWPSLVTFVYQLGSIECDVAKFTNAEDGLSIDRAIATIASRLLFKAYAEPITLTDVEDMQTIACLL